MSIQMHPKATTKMIFHGVHSDWHFWWPVTIPLLPADMFLRSVKCCLLVFMGFLRAAGGVFDVPITKRTLSHRLEAMCNIWWYLQINVEHVNKDDLSRLKRLFEHCTYRLPSLKPRNAWHYCDKSITGDDSKAPGANRETKWHRTYTGDRNTSTVVKTAQSFSATRNYTWRNISII